MKKLFRSQLIKFLPGLIVRLSSVWLLAAFAVLYYYPGSFHPIWQNSNLVWPALFFIGSLLFSILLYYWSERNSGPAGPKAD